MLSGIPNRSAWLAPEDLGYDPAIKNYPYDPKRAKQLLAEAGYPNGFKCNIYWQTGGRVPMSEQILDAIVSYLGAVGITAKQVGMEAETFKQFRRPAQKQESDFLAYDSASLTGGSDPTANAETRFLCDGSGSVYCNPEFDKIALRAKATMDDAKRAELIKQLVKILREDVASIPICDNVAVFGMRKNIDFVPLHFRVDVADVKGMTVK